ncbi:MAG TPA: carboxymuconolactone decarboxylase family protein [Blastocatellia bacterium]|nr:carboxymuconolactone decarboxylase family protein [Blastocatellia bacterium]
MGSLAPQAQPRAFSQRLTKPRIAPVTEQERDEAQRQMLAARPDFNIYKTLARHPELYSRWSGLGRFLLNGSSLPARHREMLMLRMGWLCQSEYEWAQHARIATTSAGMTDQEIHCIAEGPTAQGWTDFERSLLRMVDELRYDAMVGDTTWRELRTEYSDQRMMEALFTAAQYQLVSMALNSLGVQLDPELRHRLPRDLPLPKPAGQATGARLATPRIPALSPEQWTPQQRELINPQIRADGSVLNLYATMIQHPLLHAPRASFGLYLRQETSLPPRTRELLIMRTAFLIGAEYEWAHHVGYAKAAGLTDGEIARIAAGPDAAGWNEDSRAVLRAADGLRREAFISDRTWAILAKRYNVKQLIEIVFTVGGYTMTGLAINSFGIQLEPGYPAFPRASRKSASSNGGSLGEWTTWGGDAGFTRYSPLDQVNKDNVGTLEVAWRWKSASHGPRPDGNLKATPLMIDGVLYTPTGVHQVAAIDPAAGKTLWLFTPSPADLGGRPLTLSSRGLAYWTDGVRKRVFHNTLDGRLLSIDAKTGRADAAFGRNGTVNLKERLVEGRPIPVLGSSSPPTVVGDVVIAQVVGEATAPNKEATPGHIRGYDARTGKLLWTFHTIPQAGEFGNETWENDSWKYTGNTGVWSMMSADLELGYVYLPVESPAHDFYGGHRLGDNLFGESIVCLDARTGKRVWHFQILHHGVWDYDLPAAPILHDITVDGRTIKAVTVLTKQNMSFVFDRATGKPVWPIEERPVPQIAVPGERHSPTQPFPTKPALYSRQGYHEDDLIDFTPELKAEALAIAKSYVRGPMYTPTTPVVEGGALGTWVYPGYGGGANWNGGAFDPETGLMFVPTRNSVMVASLTKADPARTNWNFIRAPTDYIRGPRGLPINRPPWSVITATDMNRGAHVWSRSIGGAPDSIRNHPALKGLKLDFDNMGQPGVRPGPLVTKTLLFLAEAGNLSGDPGGPMFRAYDKRTGAVVAEIELPSKASGAPMTYLHEGRQYIVIAVSTRDHPAELVALALPNSNSFGQAIAGRPTAAAASSGAAPGASLQDLRAGREIYARSCAACHGPNGAGISGSTSPLLGLSDIEFIRRVVSQGSVKMPPMRTLLTKRQIEQVSRFVAVELNKK